MATIKLTEKQKQILQDAAKTGVLVTTKISDLAKAIIRESKPKTETEKTIDEALDRAGIK